MHNIAKKCVLAFFLHKRKGRPYCIGIERRSIYWGYFSSLCRNSHCGYVRNTHTIFWGWAVYPEVPDYQAGYPVSGKKKSWITCNI